MDACRHCLTVPVVKRIQVAAARTVDVALCECDERHCPHPHCKKPIGRPPIGVHRCPHCGSYL